MEDEIHLSVFLPVAPESLYRAWLDSQAHSAFTGSRADIQSQVGGKFSAWDGYIQGETLALEQFKRILQSWRAADFPPGSTDSLLEILIEPTERGSQLTLNHTHLPAGQVEDYRQGWLDYYFTPMQNYFLE
jgi:activator of HSP90 ATPase